MSELEIEEVKKAIQSGWITTGPKTKEIGRASCRVRVCQYV